MTLIERFESTGAAKRFFIVLVVFVLIMAAFLPELVIENKIFLAPDVKAPLSFATVGKEALSQGIYPLWNPYIFCGMPSFSSLAYTPYVYPVSFITHLLQAYLHFPEMTWLLLHYIMAAMGVYLLLCSLEVRPSIAVLAGVIFMLMPNYIAIGVNGHGSQACAIAYMPYVLLLLYHVFRGYRLLVTTPLLAVTLGFQLLRGHIQISYYTFLLAGFFVLFEFIHLVRQGESRRAVKGLAATLVAVIAAVGVASVLIFPVKDYSIYSIRGGGGGGLDYGYATGWSLGVGEVLTFVFPWAYGFGKATYFGSMPFTDYPNYLGIVTVIFCVLAVFIVKHRWKWFLVLVAVLSTLISFGRNFPVLYNPMFKLFPYFNRFRVPVMILIVQQLAVVVLFALGMEEFVRLLKNGKLPSWLSANNLKWTVIALVIVLLLVTVGGSGISSSLASNPRVLSRVQREWIPFLGSSYSKDLIRTVFLAALTVSLVFLALRRKVGFSLLVLSFLVITLVDLFYVNGYIVHPERGWKSEHYRIISDRSERDRLLKSDPLIEFLKTDDSLFRVFPAPSVQLERWSHNAYPFSDNRFMIFKIFSLGGYHAAKLKIYQDVMDRMFAMFQRGYIPKQILNMLNTKYLLAMYPLFKDSPVYPEVFKGAGYYVYRNSEALPRVFLVDEYTVMKNEDALNRLSSSSFDPSREVILNEEPAVKPVSKEGSRVRVVDYGLNSITLEAEVSKPCIAVLSEIYYPDWKVRIDGKEVKLLRADYCLRAMELTPGTHRIECYFSSKVIKSSLIVSVSTFIILVLVAVVSYVFIYRRS